MNERKPKRLSRLFTLSRIAPQASVCTAYVEAFLFLRDDELGTRRY